MKICVICGETVKTKMTKKQIFIATATFIIGFGMTFYIMKAYFPKHKVEKTTSTETKDKP